MNISEQQRMLAKGAVQIVPEGGLERKLLIAQKEKRPLVVKLGLDPTAPDIHLGHTVVLRKLRQFQDCGHAVVLIVGDFTAKIGDPSGRVKTRPVLTDRQIRDNADTYRAQATKVLLEDKKLLSIKLNGQWLDGMKAEELLRLCMRVTASQILSREDFQRRYKTGVAIGLHELLYPVLQGYDSVAIHADVEIGGSDQTYNILMGREVQEGLGQEPQVVMTMPIIAGTDGIHKMSKSLGNTINVLDVPEDMFGKVMSLPDALIEQYVRLCTDLAWEDVQHHKPMDAKKALAEELVTMYASKNDASKARGSFEKKFQKREFPDDAPTVTVPKGTTLLELLTTIGGIYLSKSEARRKITEGAVHIGGKKMLNTEEIINAQKGESLQMKVGKKVFLRILGG